jgi:hypothetical protein
MAVALRSRLNSSAGTYNTNITIPRNRIMGIWIIFNLLDTITTAIVLHGGGVELYPIPSMLTFSEFTLLKWLVVLIIPIVLAIYRRFSYLKWFAVMLVPLTIYNIFLLVTAYLVGYI